MHLDNDAVRELRLDRGWTQQQLADACGVSMRTVQRVEKDGVASLETTTALGVVFGVERRDLLRVSSPGEVETVSTISLKLIVLGTLLGFVVGVMATLFFVSDDEVADSDLSSSSEQVSAVTATVACRPEVIGARGSAWSTLAVDILRQSRACGWVKTFVYLTYEWARREPGENQNNVSLRSADVQ